MSRRVQKGAQGSAESFRETRVMAEGTAGGTGTVRVKTVCVNATVDDGVDPLLVLLASKKHTMSAVEDAQLKKRLDHAEKAHRGISWPFSRQER